jgi:hypothetical protein
VSHFFRDMLSMCTIDVNSSDPATKVTVVWGAASGAAEACPSKNNRPCAEFPFGTQHSPPAKENHHE